MYPNEIELNKLLTKLENKFLIELKQINEIQSLSRLGSSYIGKNNNFINILQQISNLDSNTQKEFKKKIYFIKKKIHHLLKEKKIFLEKQILSQKLKKEEIDVSMPPFQFPQGCIHPLNQTIQQIENFFLGLGYFICEGKEIETDLYNFELLNIYKEHPSRDMQDSFYLNLGSEFLLRTHTSGIQIRTMLQNPNQSFKMISSGKVYRRDKDDDTHSHQFTQLEGLSIGPKVNLIDLKETITSFVKYIFGPKQELRFRPSYFPFTKPSFEVDLIIKDKNQNTKYLEILGAGMVNPKVLSNGGIDNQKYNGLAFGLGIERITMLKYNIHNIRHFYNNDLRFLSQFI